MLNMWILVADSGAARFFTADSPTGALREREDFMSPGSRARDKELGSDKPGRTFDSAGPGRHAKGKEESPREREAMNFARLLAERVGSARARGELDRLIIVAAPEFLGMLRASMDGETRKRVEKELSLNLVDLKPDEIRKRLPERLYSELAPH